MKKNIENFEQYNPSIENGLTLSQVEKRIKEGNINITGKKYSKSYLSIFVSNFCTIFNLLGLIVCLALLYIKFFLNVEVNITNFVFVLVFLANIGTGIIQEIKAKRCIEKLSLISNKNTIVIRDGKRIEISYEDIVLEDVLLLTLGSQIPSDSVILDGNVEVNESLLTGESIAVKKQENSKLFAGSFITSGTCYAKVVSVGKENYIAKLSEKAKKYKKPHSELMSSLNFIIKMISVAIFPISILYFLKSVLVSQADVGTAILKTSTVVIGMIPSGMFLLTTLTLAVGTIKLATHKTLVQDLYSLETLARVDTICFDKTGTITDGKMSVKQYVLLNNDNTDVNRVVSSMLYSLKDTNQTAVALNSYFGSKKYFDAKTTLPFDSKRKFSAITFKDDKTYALGAPEFILSKEEYAKLNETINDYAKFGFRVLLLATSNSQIEHDTIKKDFSPVALIILEDNIRKEAIKTVKWFKENDVEIKVISGDNPLTVSEVSKRVGIINADKFISLEGKSDKEVYDSATKFTVFGRVSPEQKAILIKALKDAKHTTAMTGDGVNDILALKEADCAITVASGSSATRNVSHLVLLDNNFDSMPQIVFEGRRVINNVQSCASLYLMKTVFTMLMALSTLFLRYLITYPFELSQMNLIEIFVIGVPSFALSMQPNKNKVEGSFISQVLSKALPGALIMFFSVAIIEIYKLIFQSVSNEICITMQIFALTLSGLIALFFICKPLNKYRKILFFSVLSILLFITIFTLTFGLNALSLVKMPINIYWFDYILLVLVIAIQIPVYYFLLKVCKRKK